MCVLWFKIAVRQAMNDPSFECDINFYHFIREEAVMFIHASILPVDRLTTFSRLFIFINGLEARLMDQS